MSVITKQQQTNCDWLLENIVILQGRTIYTNKGVIKVRTISEYEKLGSLFYVPNPNLQKIDEMVELFGYDFVNSYFFFFDEKTSLIMRFPVKDTTATSRSIETQTDS